MSSLDITNNLIQQLTKARQEINNLRKQLNALQYIHHKDIVRVIETVNNWQCNECKKRKDASERLGAIPAPNKAQDLEFKPIGIISSEFPQIRGTPRQPTITMYNTTAKLTLNRDVFTNPSHALQDLHHFSHLWIIFTFHKNSNHAKAKVAPPRLNGARTGVFATRSPHRPCPIGLSLVKIEKIVDNIIYFTGVDMIDQTPVLDIKPYIPQYDQPGVLFDQRKPNFMDKLEYLEDCNMPDSEENDIIPHHYLGTKVELLANKVLLGQDNNLANKPTETSISSFGYECRTSNGLQSEEVRVPSWIDQAPVHKLTVTFKEDALTQLHTLDPELADERSRLISNVLQEDPRSVFLREKRGCTFYVWKIVNLCVACKFNDVDHTVEITRIFLNDRQ